eukprot:3864426-Rhodomonas_salina.1
MVLTYAMRVQLAIKTMVTRHLDIFLPSLPVSLRLPTLAVAEVELGLEPGGTSRDLVVSRGVPALVLE